MRSTGANSRPLLMIARWNACDAVNGEIEALIHAAWGRGGMALQTGDEIAPRAAGRKRAPRAA